MNEEYFCKYCGEPNEVLMFLTSGVCSKSPNKLHQLYKGTKRGRHGGNGKFSFKSRRTKYPRYYGKNRHYFCKYCGHPHVTIENLSKNSCIKSPTGFHQPYEGEDKPVYTCKYCNSYSKSIKKLTRGSCSESPNKHHQPDE